MVQDKNGSVVTDWQKEKAFLDRERASHPELFVPRIAIDDDATLQEIGIDPAVLGTRIRGHVKLFPEDFIVEELSQDGALHTIDTAPLFSGSSTENGKTIWCDLVKIGIDTLEAVEELSRQLGVEKKYIGVAGIKDKRALTSQSLSIRGIKRDKLATVSATHFFLKNIIMGKGALSVGALRGNRFTIVVRTEGAPEPHILETKIRDLQEQGFWNFFYLQRFGTPRLISHQLGLLILQERYEDVVKMTLTHASSREVQYFQDFRVRLSWVWGNTEALLEAIEPFPHTFRNEKKMLLYLRDHPGDFIGALNQAPEQIKLWIYAYGSWLFNQTLSQLIINGGDVPFMLPIPFSRDSRADQYYGSFFMDHRIRPPFRALRNFPYIRMQDNEIETLKQFTLYGSSVVPEGIILDFSLDKGAYATTFLAHFLTLSSGEFAPIFVRTGQVDGKSMLGTGSIMEVKKRFDEVFAMREEKRLSGGEPVTE